VLEVDGPVAYALAGIATVAIVAYAIWAWKIGRRIGSPPPDRPGHETKRFRFKYGAQPPGSDSPPQ
jgi:hypothetical protein